MLASLRTLISTPRSDVDEKTRGPNIDSEDDVETSVKSQGESSDASFASSND